MGLLDSRKFRALILAVVLMGIIIVSVGAMVFVGKASFSEFVEITKWAIASLSAVVGVFMAAVGYEDGQAKSVGRSISAGGDVSVTTAPAPGPALVTVTKTIPPAAPPGPNVTSGLVLLLLFGYLTSACAQGTFERKVLDVAAVARCVLDHYDPSVALLDQAPTLGLQCGIEDRKEIVDIITAHKAAMKREGDKLGACAPRSPNDPTKVLP